MGPFSFDLTTIAAVWMGGVLLLVPLAGLVLRVGVVPLLKAVAELRRSGSSTEGEGVRERLSRLERRVAMMEAKASDRPERGRRIEYV